jgi:hypothetical protein
VKNEIEMSLSEFAKVLAPVGHSYNAGNSIVKVLELSHFNSHNNQPVYRLLILHWNWNNKLIDGAINCLGVKVIFDQFDTKDKFEVDPADFYQAFDNANKLFWKMFWQKA